MHFRIHTLVFFLSIAAVFCVRADTRLGPLGNQPDWKRLDPYQQTITKEDFLQLLDVYAPNKAYRRLIDITDKEAFIRTGLPGEAGLYKLLFATKGAAAKAPSRYWRKKNALGGAVKTKPLAGLRIALDAGHIGGAFARMEERWFKIGEGQAVKEGEMTLGVAKRIAPALEKLGAKVSLVRPSLGPVTKTRPKDYIPMARAQLERAGVVDPPLTYDPEGPRETRGRTIQWHSEKLFYRTSEIRARAALVNDRLKPDVVVCIHFNAEAWGDPNEPDFVPRNHLHVLVNGTYSAGELRFDDVRLDMLLRLLQRVHGEELAVSSAVATALARGTGLPAYQYNTPNARRVNDNPYIYARNLLANRIYLCPVVYLEPYVMNFEEVYQRVQLGDYKGRKEINGTLRANIFDEYASSVVEGLVDYYSKRPAK